MVHRLPIWILGPGEQPDLLTQGWRPSAVETLLLLSVAGAVGTELLPNRKKIDSTVALVIAAGGNAQRNR
jgi:hypothetical protein